MSPRSTSGFAAASVARALVLAGALVGSPQGVTADGPHFVERAEILGIDHRYTGGWEHFVGGGVAALDCNGDDLPELFAAGGSGPAVLLVNTTRPGSPLAYVEDTPAELRRTGVIGAYPLDVDGDGHRDLVVLTTGEDQLLLGNGDCRFRPAPAGLGFVARARWSTAFSATFENGASLPTLAFGHYVDRANPDGPFEACDTNTLYRPTTAGRYGPPVELAPGYCALSMLFSDWGRRGRADLRVSNDRHYYVRGGSEQLWAMEATPRRYGAEEGWRDTAIWGMGIASRDLDGDGRPEVYLTSMGDQKLHSLVDGASGPAYADAPYERGITAHRPYTGGDGRPSTGWHAAFGDVDNDGLDDLFVAKGNVEAMPGSAMDDPNNLLMQAPDGRFVERGDAAGVASMARGRGAVLTDLDLDGRLDLVVVNRNAPLEIHHNRTTTTGRWLLVAVRQDGPNRDGVGAWLQMRAGGRDRWRELAVGGGHVSGSASFEHFGLGDRTDVQVRVHWPDGVVSHWQPLPVSRRWVLHRHGPDLEVLER